MILEYAPEAPTNGVTGGVNRSSVVNICKDVIIVNFVCKPFHKAQ